MLVAAQQFKGLVASSAPGSASLGECYLNTTDSRVYICTNATGPVWTALDKVDHGTYANLTADDHTD